MSFIINLTPYRMLAKDNFSSTAMVVILNKYMILLSCGKIAVEISNCYVKKWGKKLYIFFLFVCLECKLN